MRIALGSLPLVVALSASLAGPAGADGGKGEVVIIHNGPMARRLDVTCDQQYLGCVRHKHFLTAAVDSGVHLLAAGQFAREPYSPPTENVAELGLRVGSGERCYLRTTGLFGSVKLERLDAATGEELTKEWTPADLCPERDHQPKSLPVGNEEAILYVMRSSSPKGPKIGVMVDGTQVGRTTEHNDFLHATVTPGHHRLGLSDTRKLLELDVEGGRVYYLELQAFSKYGSTLVPVSLGYGRVKLAGCRLTPAK